MLAVFELFVLICKRYPDSNLDSCLCCPARYRLLNNWDTQIYATEPPIFSSTVSISKSCLMFVGRVAILIGRGGGGELNLVA